MSTFQPLIIAVLGPPGSGKGTQCQRLSQAHPDIITHISIGDMLRTEMSDASSPYAKILRENMIAGRLGPPEMTVSILEKRIPELAKEKRLILLDGFPRALTPLQLFEERIAPIQRAIVLDCPEETLLERLKARARFDDQAGPANLKERMRTFREQTSEVIDAFEARGSLRRVDGVRDVETVAEDVDVAVADLLEEARSHM